MLLQLDKGGGIFLVVQHGMIYVVATCTQPGNKAKSDWVESLSSGNLICQLIHSLIVQEVWGGVYAPAQPPTSSEQFFLV